MDSKSRIIVGPIAGSHFWGPADLQVAYHVHRGERHGLLMKRKRLVNRSAYQYDPRLGWEVDVWFEWDDEKAQ